jgi:transposase
VKPTYKPLTHLEWEKVCGFFEYEAVGHGRPRCDVRVAVDAVLHVMTTKCGWDGLPEDRGYPSPVTVKRRHGEWKDSGALDKAMAYLCADGRQFYAWQFDPVEEKPVKRASTLYRAAETLEAMQQTARERLMAGIPANWREEEKHV